MDSVTAEVLKSVALAFMIAVGFWRLPDMIRAWKE